MIRLYQFERTWGIPNLSPFCCKVETYMRMAGIDYEIISALPADAPKGKLPYIDDDGKIIADSHFILMYLKSVYNDLDGSLDNMQRSVSLAMQHLLEDHLFWCAFYSRWQYTDENWHVNRDAIFGKLPSLIRYFAAWHTRRKIRNRIIAQGIGGHQAEEIFTMGKQDIDALSGFLGNKPYFLGDKPTVLDASAFGMLVNIIGCPIESPLKEHGSAKNNLKDFVARISQNYYPDLQSV
ncbi:glutathione S-transferase family protein [Nitrosomonas marina]|uniref:Glutathione S-transferase n=1 Tax=Nitrosomonas marina TaxID=917 RepID=A0A1H8CP26_9PROT|nr:glutathione S-transferase family protein [Nitrosomonas marina]SEM97011.1 Glutathione S-transferase [Nitrosomonas marina]